MSLPEQVRTKLITHTDLDGVGCAIVLKEVMGKDVVDVIYTYPNKVNEYVNKVLDERDGYDIILVTDLSIDKETAERVQSIYDNLKEGEEFNFALLDHHRNLEWLNEYKWATVVPETENSLLSGTYLTFINVINGLSEKDIEIITQTKLYEFVEAVRRYDTWEWVNKYDNYKLSKDLSNLLKLEGIEDFIENILRKLEEQKELISPEEALVLYYKDKEVDELVKRKDKCLIPKRIEGHNAAVVFAENNISELGNRLCELHPEYDFIAMINQNTVSLRSAKEDIDLSLIAKKYGGGGHAPAAGFPLPEGTIENLIGGLFNE